MNCPLCDVEVRVHSSECMGPLDSVKHPYVKYGEECPLANMPTARSGGIPIKAWTELSDAINELKGGKS